MASTLFRSRLVIRRRGGGRAFAQLDAAAQSLLLTSVQSTDPTVPCIDDYSLE